MSDKQIKVTDKRMFTPEGELREEYRFLSEESSGAEPPAPAAASAPEPMPAAPEPAARGTERRDPREADSTARLELPGTPPGVQGLDAPSFYDLVAVLAEPVALYLGDLELPDGQESENLEMARLHIELLDVLRQKTLGNLTAQEIAFLEDLLYRLRVRYVQKRG